MATIKISNKVKEKLDRLKLIEIENYKGMIEFLVEENIGLDEKTKKDLEESRKSAKKGEVYTREEVEKMFDL